MLLSGGGISFFLRDWFTNDQSLPAAGNTFNPSHKGLWEVEQDNVGTAAITGSEIFLPGTDGATDLLRGAAIFGTDGNGNPFSHVGGLVFGQRWRVEDLGFSDWAHMSLDAGNSPASKNAAYQWHVGNGFGILVRPGNIAVGVTADSTGATTYESWIVLTNDGKALMYADLVGDGYATLYWIYAQEALSTVYAWLWAREVDLYVKTAAVVSYALSTFDATGAQSGSISAATTISAAPANQSAIWTVTQPSSGENVVRIRDDGSNSYIKIRISSTQILVDEVVSGTPSSLATATWSGNATLQLLTDGTAIKIYEDTTSRINTTSSLNTALAGIQFESYGTSGAAADYLGYFRRSSDSGLTDKLDEVIQE